MNSLRLYLIAVIFLSETYWCRAFVANEKVLIEKFEIEENLPDTREIVSETILRKFIQTRENVQGMKKGENSCACQGYDCGCCFTLDIKTFQFKEKACLNISYLPSEYGIELDLSINGRVVVKEKISAKNPPPICAEVPYIQKLASLCVRFYKLSYNQRHLSGCVKLEVRLAGLDVEDINIGCFSIPPTSETMGLDEDRVISVE